MKNIILAVIICLAIPSLAHSSVYVYADKNSKEVIFITESDNVVISSDDESKIEETILPHDIAFYELTEDYSLYKFSNGKFTLNTQKISNIEDKKNADKEKHDKKNADFETAKEKLMSAIWEPLTSDEVDSLR